MPPKGAPKNAALSGEKTKEKKRNESRGGEGLVSFCLPLGYFVRIDIPKDTGNPVKQALTHKSMQHRYILVTRRERLERRLETSKKYVRGRIDPKGREHTPIPQFI